MTYLFPTAWQFKGNLSLCAGHKGLRGEADCQIYLKNYFSRPKHNGDGCRVIEENQGTLNSSPDSLNALCSVPEVLGKGR